MTNNLARGDDLFPTTGVRLTVYALIALPLMMSFFYFTQPERFDSPPFQSAQGIAPIQAWGGLFLVVALMLAVALYLSREMLMKVLVASSGAYAIWAILFALSALDDPHASPNGVLIYGFVAWQHFASAQTLAEAAQLEAKARAQAAAPRGDTDPA